MTDSLEQKAATLMNSIKWADASRAEQAKLMAAFAASVREQTVEECAKVLCEICATGKSYHRFMEAVPHLDDAGEWRHEPKKIGGSCLCDAAEIRALALPIPPPVAEG